jgi:hypothetical protein
MENIKDAQKMDCILNGLGNAIDTILKQEFGEAGFALVVFRFGDATTGNYISNAQREDMIEVLRIVADRLEKHEDIPPAWGPVH